MKRTTANPLTRMRYPRLVAVLLFLTPHSPLGVVPADADDPRATVEHYYKQWQALMKKQQKLDHDEFTHEFVAIVDELFYLDTLAPQILPGRWPALSERQQEVFVEALKSSIEHKVLAYIEKDRKRRIPSLKFKKKESTQGGVTLEYSMKRGRTEDKVTVTMLETSDAKWQITDVRFGDKSILDYYKNFSSKLIKDYSFPYLVAELGEYPFITLEDFEGSPVGEMPAAWTWKPKDNDKRKPYVVSEENGNRYLAATDTGESVIIGKDIKWNLKKYPFVSFRWRAHEIPEGADERYDKKVDSAAGIYFIYKNKLGLIPESVKYVWSSTLPVGAAMQRKGLGKPWMVVAETGTDHLGEWRTYVFNMAEAYTKTYGGKPPNKPIGIGILSDANSMKGHAYADYDDIRALRTAEDTVDSGVRQKMETYKQ
ncbi:MAG: DUF3047 domain-containing protein [Gemmatimonadales bacterium]